VFRSLRKEAELINKGVGVLALVLGLFLTVMCYAQDQSENKEIKTISGTVRQLDWVGSVIIVRCLNVSSSNYDETTFYVTDDTKISRGINTVTLSAIEQGDEVTVDYYDDSFRGLVATRIVDKNLGNR
jgi:hypothetical protein